MFQPACTHACPLREWVRVPAVPSLLFSCDQLPKSSYPPYAFNGAFCQRPQVAAPWAAGQVPPLDGLPPDVLAQRAVVIKLLGQEGDPATVSEDSMLAELRTGVIDKVHASCRHLKVLLVGAADRTINDLKCKEVKALTHQINTIIGLLRV